MTDMSQFVKDFIEAEWRKQLSKQQTDICREVAEHAQIAIQHSYTAGKLQMKVQKIEEKRNQMTHKLLDNMFMLSLGICIGTIAANGSPLLTLVAGTFALAVVIAKFVKDATAAEGGK